MLSAVTEPFAAYVRTSTEDNQSPEDSKRWQLALADQLIRPHGSITVVYHDIDVSRSLPWSRRPEASRLLDDLTDRGRGWRRLVTENLSELSPNRNSNSSSQSFATTAWNCGCRRSAVPSIRTVRRTTLS